MSEKEQLIAEYVQDIKDAGECYEAIAQINPQYRAATIALLDALTLYHREAQQAFDKLRSMGIAECDILAAASQAGAEA